MAVKTVFFDVGETLVDETRHWFSWADWLGIPRLTFGCVLGAIIARGEHHRRVFEVLVPGFDFEQAVRARGDAGDHYKIEPQDFYSDALPTLHALKKAGYSIGIAGNQPKETETALKVCGVPADYIASSATWAVEKPSPEFFAKIANVTGLAPSEIAYVGDRLDNDVLPAQKAGMYAVFLVRGPWGFLHARTPEATLASAKITCLTELPLVLNA
ncbi:HAD-IA family hydrolase (plasmid) [Rhizobium sp. CB3171]|uniref:HAD family hydrolase n=1 Tax=Rhizobium sp. CB3171 TaxID=3039157 RepID=UPI0024B237B0|nr:HAD-IA family hydrolase [Rhizobium sp. CB3171]WFU07214.1 HAD-IA family hydrolase [Rhizobium sp. CB3171]